MKKSGQNECDCEHDFTLLLKEDLEFTDDVEDALLAACDDATVSVRCGRVCLTFSRAAASLKEAILSAIQNVRNAGIGADVLRVDVCNLVSQADIARRIARSRQSVHLYTTGQRGPGGFPSPACNITDDSPLWYWCEVAHWLFQHDMIQESVLREAQEVAAINSVLEYQLFEDLTPETFGEIVSVLMADDPLDDCESCP